MVSSCFQPSATPAMRSTSPSNVGSTPASASDGTATGTPTSRNAATETSSTTGPGQRHTAPSTAMSAPSSRATATAITYRNDSYTGQNATEASATLSTRAIVQTSAYEKAGRAPVVAAGRAAPAARTPIGVVMPPPISPATAGDPRGSRW
jgi:hypothetical protein